jgi:hypothetical protein
VVRPAAITISQHIAFLISREMLLPLLRRFSTRLTLHFAFHRMSSAGEEILRAKEIETGKNIKENKLFSFRKLTGNPS